MALASQRRHVNVGRDPMPGYVSDERYQKVLQENQQLKVQRNDLDTKLRDLKTKFQRLTRDLKQSGVNVDALLAETSPPKSSKDAGFVQSKLLAVTQQRDELQLQLQETNKMLKLRGLPQQQQQQQHVSGGRTPRRDDSQMNMKISALEREVQHLRSQLDEERRSHDVTAQDRNSQRRLLETATSVSQPSSGRHHYEDGSASEELRREVYVLRERAANDGNAIEALSRERDSLMLKVKMHEVTDEVNVDNNLNSATVLELQHHVNEKSTQLTVVQNRLSYAQNQVMTLKQECERLVEELKNVHTQNSDIKKRMFDLENDRSAMQVRCEKMSELEQLSRSKSEELIKTEQELLRMVDRMNACTRETESQVRREMNERITELEEMRNDADRQRRAADRDNFALQQELGDAKRRAQAADSDADLYKQELAKVKEEKQDLLDRNALLNASGFGASSRASDDLHKAATLVALQKRAKGNVDLGELWEGAEWSDGWELSKMREALHSSTLNLEMSVNQLEALQGEKTALTERLDEICGDRDSLLGENIEMRRRISGVQTALAKQQLRRIDELEESGAEASITIYATKIACDDRIQRLGDGTVFSPTLFLSVDGMEGFETVLSDNFFSLAQELSAKFRYGGLGVKDLGLDALQATVFSFQLHQAFGVESEIIATAELPSTRLLRCRHDGVLNDTLSLRSVADGTAIGTLSLRAEVSSMFVPLLLDRPLLSSTADPACDMSPDRINALILSFRSVRALRVQVSRAANLGMSAAGALPCPYVFYTGVAPAGRGISCIEDTVLHQIGGRQLTSSPTFDELPVDHKVVVDSELVRFLIEGSITFVVFDNNASDVQEHLGLVNVPLRPLLEATSSAVVKTLDLHPSGTLDVGMSWVLDSY